MTVVYHGKVVTEINTDQYCLQSGVLTEYVTEDPGTLKRVIEASIGYYHIRKRCLPGSFGKPRKPEEKQGQIEDSRNCSFLHS